MNTLLAVFIGGGLGSLARYCMSLLTTRFQLTSFPWATLVSNTASSLIIGILIGAQLAGKDAINSIWKNFLAIGFCGGFSTFSAFSMETVELAKSGFIQQALMNGAANVSLSILATLLGIWIGRQLVS